MGIISAPNVVRDGLVAVYDAASIRSFRGEPTTNYSRNVRDFSGTAYASSDEWSSDPTRLTKSYISTIQTPIGNGATLIYESGTAGYHHLSRYGGGDESGAHSISCYVRPVTTDITEFMIGMLGDGGNSVYFNLNTLAISYGGGISNRNAFIETVPGYTGWYRVGANIEGRVGGWVGAVGYSIHTSYTGTAGNKRCYITGIQYEFTSKPTQFLEAEATRGTTNATGGGWVDLSGNSNHGELVNGPTYNSSNGGSIVFDGSNDYISIVNNSTLRPSTELTIEYSIKGNTPGSWNPIIGYGNGDYTNGNYLSWVESGGALNALCRINNSGVIEYRQYSGQSISSSTWKIMCFTMKIGDVIRSYHNGVDTNTPTSLPAGGTFYYGGTTSPYQIVGLGGSWLNGNIGHMKLYSRALTGNEVLQNFEATRARFGV